MPTPKKKAVSKTKTQTRPSEAPIPVRFTPDMLAEIEAVSAEFDMSRQDVIRLATSAGLKAMKKLTKTGLIDAIATQIDGANLGASSADAVKGRKG